MALGTTCPEGNEPPQEPQLISCAVRTRADIGSGRKPHLQWARRLL